MHHRRLMTHSLPYPHPYSMHTPSNPTHLRRYEAGCLYTFSEASGMTLHKFKQVGAWYIGTWYMVRGTRYMVHSAWYIVHRYMVHRYMVHRYMGHRYMGHRYMGA